MLFIIKLKCWGGFNKRENILLFEYPLFIIFFAIK